MSGVKTILAATDFSRSAAIALRRAAQLARAASARLELVHVLSPELMPSNWSALRGALGFDTARMRDDARDRLRAAADQIGAEHALSVVPHLAQGRAHSEITDRAGAIGADLVVVGAHGEHFVLDVFIGTTAQRLQRLCAVPVLVVRQAPFHPYRQVVLATDFSPASATAAQTALRFFPHAMFHLLHVFAAPFESRLGLDEAGVDNYRRQLGEQAQRELESFVRQVGLEGRTASVKVRRGYAPARIKELATELDADLVVLGTEGRSRLAIGLLGSVSGHVAAESSADVLLVRPVT